MSDKRKPKKPAKTATATTTGRTPSKPAVQNIPIPPQTPEQLASDLKTSIVVPTVSGSIVIASADDYDKAGMTLKRIDDAIKLVQSKFEPVVSAAYSTWKKLTEMRKEIVDPLDQRKRDVAGLMSQWKVKEAQALQAERRRREEEERRIYEQSLADLRQQRAEEAAESGESDEVVAAILEGREAEVGIKPTPEPIVVSEEPLPVPRPAVSKGASERTNYQWEVEDMEALIKAVADGKVPAEVLCLNTVYLNMVTKNPQTRAGMIRWAPYVKVTESVGVAVKRRG